jgi:3-deoxy-D-manno-octulosonate 8-phosphate phosphatase (KDO 8-P phosphatase)
VDCVVIRRRIRTRKTLRINRDTIDALVFDFDGVLTDNRVFVFDDGREAVFCNRADGLAFDDLRDVGLPCFIISKESNPVVGVRARKLKLPVVQACDDKDAALRELCASEGFELRRIVYVGNDLNDLAAMGIAGLPIAVADAHPRVQAAAKHVLKTAGGAGIVRELFEGIVFQRGAIRHSK